MKRRQSTLAKTALHLFAGVALSAAAGAWANGASDSSVSLPEGPGSLEGVGENINTDGNMGLMSWSMPIAVPAGFGGVTPSISLSYSSGGGVDLLGMGWSMATESVERMTVRGLPEYDADDEFAANGADELVRIPGSDPAVYRSRREGTFTRWIWEEIGDGSDGYWRAEYANGVVGYFGADADGNAVSEARLQGDDGTFRYQLVEKVDPYGHREVWEYAKSGGSSPIPVSVGWVFGDDDNPRYKVEFSYELREDPQSDARPGFEDRLEHRMTGVEVFNGGTTVRSYEIDYQPYDEAGGFSRIAEIRALGAEGGENPVHPSFDYTDAVQSICGASSCDGAIIRSVGNIGTSLSGGDATLVDLNGDALPDFIDTAERGTGSGTPHRIFLSQLESDGTQSYLPASDSALGTSGGHRLSSPRVQSYDVNGDGFTDLINTQTGEALINTGVGDWGFVETIDITDTPVLTDSDGDGDTDGFRFFDYDNDKRIDLLRSEGTGASNITRVWRNTEGGFVEDENVEQIGFGFLDDKLQLSDMNGDGLLDAVRLDTNAIRYRIYEGWGRWSGGIDDWVEDVSVNLTEAELEVAEIEDLTGDGLSDVVVVTTGQIKLWVNDGKGGFDSVQTITSLEGDAVPQRLAGTAVLYADMNGNGSSDIVWVDTNGNVTFADLFPIRPHLLSEIRNNIGFVQQIEYSTSVQEAAIDREAGNPWDYQIPNAMIVVSETTITDELSNLPEVTEFDYENAYYDGDERQFRGYEIVTRTSLGDANHESGKTVTSYMLGVPATSVDDTLQPFVDSYYFAGLQLKEEGFALTGDGSEEPLAVEESEWGDCEVTIEGIADQSGLLFPVRHICMFSSTRTIQERRPESEWVVTRSEQSYDGYGNVVSSTSHGVTSIGGGACGDCPADGLYGQACGASCTGDESYTETEYVTPLTDTGDRWITGAAYRNRTSNSPTGPWAVDETYYDGAAFTGLPLGELAEGTVVRTRQLRDDDNNRVEPFRARLDAHGNAVETLDALGDPGSAQNHRTLTTYDSSGLFVTQTSTPLTSPDGTNYELRTTFGYDDIFDRPNENSGTLYVEGGTVQTLPRTSYVSYDEFGRVASIVKPGGDTLALPTEEYEYDIGAPVTRIYLRGRSEVGGPVDEETVRCLDGRGREYQSRIRLDSGEYFVSGFKLFDARGGLARVYQPWTSTSDECDTSAPTGVEHIAMSFDAAHRPLTTEEPTVTGASVLRTEYLPLETLTFDQEDTNTGGPHADTPLRVVVDGLGRTTLVERVTDDGELSFATARYDVRGHLAVIEDDQGNQTIQTNDALGRVLSVDDPDTGLMQVTYDDLGSKTSVTDGRGVTVLFEYDGANRQIGQWDADDEAGTRVTSVWDRDADCPSCVFGEGQVVSISYPVQGAEWTEYTTYDARGRASSIDRDTGDFVLSTEVVYDNGDEMIRRVFPDGRELEYSYDDAGRLLAVDGVVESIAYADSGRISELNLGNGLSGTFAHDAQLRLEALAWDMSGDAVYDVSLTRDLVGNITDVQDNLGAPWMGVDRNATYEYDDAYRLLSAELSGPDGAETVSFTYDTIDNILSQTSSLGSASAAHIGNYVYGGGDAGPHSVTRAGATGLEYDGAGNVTTRGATALGWDFLGRRVIANDDAHGPVAIAYNGSSSRVYRRTGDAESHYVDGEFEVVDGISDVYVRVKGTLAARLRSADLAAVIYPDVSPTGGDGTISAADAWEVANTGGDADTVDAMLRSSARRLLLEEGDEATYFATDMQGSVIGAFSEAGDSLLTQAYYPYGEAMYPTQGLISRGYTGLIYDGEEAMMQSGTRAYDPAIGRWMSSDAAFSVLSASAISGGLEALSEYAYVLGNPINYADPFGTKRKRLGKGVSRAFLRARARVSRKARTKLRNIRHRRRLGRDSNYAADVSRNAAISAVESAFGSPENVSRLQSAVADAVRSGSYSSSVQSDASAFVDMAQRHVSGVSGAARYVNSVAVSTNSALNVSLANAFTTAFAQTFPDAPVQAVTRATGLFMRGAGDALHSAALAMPLVIDDGQFAMNVAQQAASAGVSEGASSIDTYRRNAENARRVRNQQLAQ